MNTAITMQVHTENYLSERRRLGYRLRSPARALRSFARYIDNLGLEEPLTVEIMAAWARRAKTHEDNPATWARRLKLLRPFARYLQQFDPRTEVPDHTVFGRLDPYLAPHIYHEQEIVDLLAAARHLAPDLRGATYEALFGLLASTGLRVSEAVNLKNIDADLKGGHSKRSRDQVRQVPPGTAASEHGRGIAKLPSTARPLCLDHGRGAILCRHPGPASRMCPGPSPGASGIPAFTRANALGQPRRPRHTAYS